MAAGNILISYADWAQDPNVTIFGGPFETNLPATNMLTLQPQYVAQGTGGSVSFSVSLGATRNIGLVHFQNLITDPAGSMSIDIGGVWNSGVIPTWGNDAGTPYNTLEYAALGRPRFIIPPAPIAADVVFVQIDGLLSPLQIGYIGICEVWQPPYNMSYNWVTSYMDLSEIQRIPFGSTYVNPRPKPRRLAFGIDWIPDDRPYVGGINYVPTVRQLMAIAGMSSPILAVPFPDDTDNIEREAVWGLFSAAPEISNPFFAHYAATFQIDELV